MAKGKRYRAAADGIDANKEYLVAEAIQMVKSGAKAKFDETIEIAMNLGVDPRHADQMVRGVVSLPSGTGKSVRGAVFATDHKAEAAQKAGAANGGAHDRAEPTNDGSTKFHPLH